LWWISYWRTIRRRWGWFQTSVRSRSSLLAGYILGVFAGSVFAPAAGSLINELFPTSVRASVTGGSLAAAA
jgi:hypothetical protein